MASVRPVFVIGDVHGELAKVIGLLQAAELIDHDCTWVGRDAELWFTGDFFDRGVDGIGTVDLIMRLQAEAAATGGHVGALLGNHEPLFLAVHRFEQKAHHPGLHFRDIWERNGGQQRDLERLTPEHIAWMVNLPAMKVMNGWLLVHADALMYTKYGRTIDEVNWAFGAVLRGSDSAAWDKLLYRFSERLAFTDGGGSAAPDTAAARFNERYGGQRIVHGHTPISLVTGTPPDQVTAPLTYAGGRCVNIDGGMCLGCPGFVFELHRLDPDERPAPKRRSGWRLW
jgi:hypothetical protein